jgi:transposase
MSLPYSDTLLLPAYPHECNETFEPEHLAAFSIFGRVRTKTAYDNTSIAVRKAVGATEREFTREFLYLERHCHFRLRFCWSARGNEKGHVEKLVGYGRRKFLAPSLRSDRSPI